MSSNLKNTQQQVPSAVDNTSIFERFNNISNNYSDYSFINYHYESIQNNNSSHYNDFHSTWGGAILFAISATAVIS